MVPKGLLPTDSVRKQTQYGAKTEFPNTSPITYRQSWPYGKSSDLITSSEISLIKVEITRPTDIMHRLTIPIRIVNHVYFDWE
jgi:hypothetical protein